MLKRKLAADTATQQRKHQRLEHHDLSRYINKQRCLVISSRGVSHRARHLLADLRACMAPHAKEDVKLDTKSDLAVINSVADLKNCSSALYLEARGKRRAAGADLYLYAGATPAGPTVKFEVQNIHTMAETKLTGNCLKGSRAVLVFDAAFDDVKQPHLQLMKTLLHQCFNVPKAHPKSKPFIDHCMSFFLCDGRIWVRHYQIIVAPLVTPEMQSNTANKPLPTAKASQVDPQLIEIGPRFTLSPIKIMSGAFQGAVLWHSETYTTPGNVRSAARAAAGSSYVARLESKQRAAEHKQQAVMPVHAVDAVYEPEPEAQEDESDEADEAQMQQSALSGLAMIDEEESSDDSQAEAEEASDSQAEEESQSE